MLSWAFNSLQNEIRDLKIITSAGGVIGLLGLISSQRFFGFFVLCIIQYKKIQQKIKYFLYFDGEIF